VLNATTVQIHQLLSRVPHIQQWAVVVAHQQILLLLVEQMADLVVEDQPPLELLTHQDLALWDKVLQEVHQCQVLEVAAGVEQEKLDRLVMSLAMAATD
jgi:hypothetical protein